MKDPEPFIRRLPYQTLQRWMWYDSVEPIGGLRGDWHAASICSTLMNIAVSKTKSKKRFQPRDFLLEWGAEKERPEGRAARQTWQEQKMIAMMFAAMSQVPEKKKGKKR